jgi:hypothetical protein
VKPTTTTTKLFDETEEEGTIKANADKIAALYAT